MSFVIAVPEAMVAAAAELATIGSDIDAAGAAAASQTTAVLAAAEDEVSAAIAALFSAHGQGFQALSARAATFHEQCIQALMSSAESFASAEAANLTALGDMILTNIFGSPAIPSPPSEIPLFTGQQSLLTRLEIDFLLRPLRDFLTFSGIYDQMGVLGSPVQNLFVSGLLSPLFSDTPPLLLTSLLGQTVQYTTYDGMPVVEIIPANPTGNYVVALHGGAFIWPPLLFHWVWYSVTAYQTGATISVPIYPLIQQGGTAATVVPKVADFISSQIATHGASRVSVLGDSSGANIGLAAVQYLVANNQPVPASMALVSPLLSITGSNPNMQFINDPLLPPRGNMLYQFAQQWAGGLALTDPLVSPLYGSLDGLPPTHIYAGSLDMAAAEAVVLSQKAAIESAPISFVMATGGFHDWILLSPDGLRYWTQIGRQLLGS